jgi:hypothetical protein
MYLQMDWDLYHMRTRMFWLTYQHRSWSISLYWKLHCLHSILKLSKYKWLRSKKDWHWKHQTCKDLKYQSQCILGLLRKMQRCSKAYYKHRQSQFQRNPRCWLKCLHSHCTWHYILSCISVPCWRHQCTLLQTFLDLSSSQH